jgi:hypothetical protein
MKKFVHTIAAVLLMFLITSSISAQSIKIGPRLTGNLNIYNQDGLTGTWNGVGIGIGGVVDISFSKHIGILANVTVFDMKNFSNETTTNRVTTENSLSLAYLTIDPMFKAEFSGFYMVGGASLGIKINSSGERTQSATGQNPQVTTLDFETNSMKFDIATGIGYNFSLSSSMVLGTDFMAYIPLTDTYDFPGMKKLFLLNTLIALLLVFTACSNDDGNATSPFGTGGGGGGTGGDGNLTIIISSRQDQQGSTIFTATPSVAITLSKLTVSVPAEQYTESFQFDATFVAEANVTQDLLEYPAGSGVASGQQWTFQFEGTFAATNQAYNVSSNYTIP